MRFSLKRELAILSACVLVAAPFGESTLSASAASNCVLDTATTYQSIAGFGGMNLPEWVGSDLTDAQRLTAFGNGNNQLGFNIVRIFVNDDSSQWNRALATAKYAKSKGCIVFATPWNPPTSMRETFTKNGNSNSRRLKYSSYGDYAKHLNSFVSYMRQNGVELDFISIQNEPDYGAEWTWMTSGECVNFLANYADQIDCPIMSPETFQYNKDYYNAILNNSAAMKNTDVFATHFYGTSRNAMDFPALEKCGKQIWMTEVYVPNSTANSADNWPEALDVAENMHNGLAIGNMSAYVWWYIRRSYGPMKEDGNISKRGYCMAQYSKFVRNGDVRIGCTESTADKIFLSAYKNADGQVTVVAVNKNTSAQTQSFSLNSGENIASIDCYRTSGTENVKQVSAPSASGSNFQAQLPAQSVTTFILNTKSEPNADGSFFHDTFEGNTNSWTGRGAAAVETSSQTKYAGSESLLVSGRTASWNGAQKSISTGIFTPGKPFSFSVDVCYQGGTAAMQNFLLSLQYTDADGETAYDHIATGTAAQGSFVQLANQNYTIPAGATNLVLYVETEDGTGDFYIDEAIGATAGTVIEGPKPIKFQLGDVNSDETIDGADFSLAKQFLLMSNNVPTGTLPYKAADVNCDGTVSMADLVWYAQYLTGQTKEYPEKVIVETKMRTISEYTPVVQAAMAEFETNDSKQEKAGTKYGTVQSGTYFSTTCNRNKPYNILLPAGYTTDKQYPVLYVMHGYWENQDRMIIKGNGTMYTKQIIGNAIAEGAAEDMIVVFPYIYSSATQSDCTAMDDANNRAYDNFINDLTKDLMPYLEKTYSIKTGRENTAITGFSMGGRESLLIGMQRPDLFGYVGAICPAPGVSGAFKWASEEEAPSLVMITAGSNDTVVYTNPETYHNNFTKNGVPNVWHYVNGGYHGDNSIHAHIYNFVRAVFKA